ncbi:MAG: FkbM family methyltransferase [Myxococcales bacterium]|nr:FkbM family methyltransferase [Myxococcales bacterium]
MLHPYYFLDLVVIAFGGYEANFHRFIERYIGPDMVCFDAGANIGFFSVHLGKCVGPNGHVYAIEPVPYIIQRLRRHIQANKLESNCTIVEKAFSDYNGTLTIHAAQESVHNQGMASIHDHNDHLSQKLTVEAETLDHFVEANNLTRVDFIKLDIQGAEAAFLRGGENTLRKHRPILVFEISPNDLKAMKMSAHDLLSYIEGFGYTLHTIQQDGQKSAPLSLSNLPNPFKETQACAFPKA